MPATLPCPGPVPQSVLLAGFRAGLYGCLTRRADSLFCLADAVLCAGTRVTDLAGLSLVPEFGRGHGALYDALVAGRADVAGLRRLLAALPFPAWPDGRVRLAVDVTFWLRPDASASPERLLCRVKTRRGAAGPVAGWPYSFVAALGPGPSSWVVPLDAVRLGPGDDPAEVTAAQLREVITRLAAAGRCGPGRPAIVAADAGYNASRLSWLLRDLPVVLAVRVRSDRCFYRPAPPRRPGLPGRPPRHGPRLKCADAGTWAGARAAGAGSARHGPLEVLSWARVHQKLERGSGGWPDLPESRLPLVEGTLVRLAGLGPPPGGRRLPPMWIWVSDPDPALSEVAALWQAYLRRFDLEHFFRFIKGQLGWNRPLLRGPAAADRWTWLVIAAYAQLHLARPLASARLPWQPPLPPAKLTPGRVRAGFRRARTEAGTPASPPKPATPGPGRPPGSKNRSPAPRHPAGKTRLHPENQRKRAAEQATKRGKGG